MVPFSDQAAAAEPPPAVVGTELVVVEGREPFEALRVQSILDEILHLVLRLEWERGRLEALLGRERATVERLKASVEAMALRRVRELPARVQAEHDACITDITELNWHISFNQKTERKLAHRCEIEQR